MAISQPVYAQFDEFKIKAADGADFDEFGSSVSISGDYAVVGTHGDDDNGDGSGSAYVFKRNGTSWTQEAKLHASDGAAGDGFGKSVSIFGDYAIVGATCNSDNGGCSGSAYLFKRSGTSWVEEAKLLPSDGAAFDFFGSSVSISGDYAIVGAWADDDNGNLSGSAYLFKRSGTSWAEEAKLLPSDGAAGDEFGSSVSISGDYAVVGAWADDDNGNLSGSAYLFKRSGTSWAQEAKLLPFDGAAGDEFGSSVSISGDYAVVGATCDSDNGGCSGSAYLFKRSGTSWAQEAKLLPSDGAVFDFFGESVSISGDYAIVGAWADDDNGNLSGSAYLFKRSGTSWAQKVKILSSDGAAGDEFGSSVSISGDYAVVGAGADDDNGNFSGSAYLYYGYTSPVDVEGVSVSPAYAVSGMDSVVVTATVAGPANLSLFAEIEAPDQAPLDTLPLFDDGAHHDGEAGDSRFGNAWAVPPVDERIYFVDLHVSYVDSHTVSFELNNVGTFTTIGPVVLESYTLFNTLPNPGDSPFLKLSLRNNGPTATATAITADISTLDTCITEIRVEGQNSYGDIGPGATVTTAGDYIVDVNENCAGDHDILFDISIASEVFDFWSDSFSIQLVLPLVFADGWLEKSKDQVDGRFSQGVATDGVFWYFSSKGGLFKTDANFDMFIEKDGSQNPIPQFLQDQGYDHIGDIAYFEGKLYAPIEDSSYVKPIIALFDTASLIFTGDYALVPQSHIPWVAVDPRTGFFYSSEFDGVNKLFVYDPNQNFALIDEVQLDTTLSRVQGGAFLGDFLYLACDNGDYVYEVDIATGTATPVIIVPPGPEMEGIEAYALDSGVLHFVAETGGSTNIFYHYDQLLALDVRDSPKIAKIFNIFQNYPNPFNSVSTIRYELPHASDVSLIVYDLLAREVASLVDSHMEPGYHQIQWNGRNASGKRVPSGIYIARLVTLEYTNSIKMVLLK